MAEDIKESIFYAPDLKPDRHYESDAEFLKRAKKDDYVSPEPDYSKTRIIENLKKTMTQMEELLENIDDVAHLAPSVQKLRKRLEVAFPKGYVVPPKEVEPIRTEAEEAIKEEGGPIYTPEETGYTPDSIFEPGEDGIELSIIEPRSILNIAIASYARDTVDLQKYYVDSMQAILQSYYNQMLTIAAECGLTDYSILEKPVYAEKISAPFNLTHLKDFIARSQISRQQKTKYFKKTHNTDQTMVHMRRWHSAEKERERYYSEDYESADSLLAHESNELLMTSRRMYDKQYQQAFYDMYKYLDSSVSIAHDILSMNVNEAKAKGFLIKNGVNVINAIAKETKRQYLDKTVATGSNVVNSSEKKEDEKKDSSSETKPEQ